jgi:hypothetical protein
MSAGAIRAGQAFVELFAKDNRLYRALDQAKKGLSQFASFAAKSMGGGIAALGTPMTAMGNQLLNPIKALFAEVAGRGAGIDSMAKRFGTTTENISELAFGFEKAGVDLKQFGGVMDGLAGRIVTAANANEELIDGLRGLNGRQLINKDIGTQLDMIAEKFKTIVLAEDQIKVAADLGLSSILSALKKGKAGIDEYRQAARDAGGVVSPEEAARSAAVMKSLTDAWQTVKYAILEVGSALLPTTGETKSLLEQFRAGVKTVREWTAENRGLIRSVAAIGAGLVAAGAVMAGVGGAITVMGTIAGPVFAAIGTAVGLTIAAVKLLAVGVLALVSPIGAVAIAVGGLAYLFATQTESGREMVSETKSNFSVLADTISTQLGKTAETAKSTWASITSALKQGDLKGAAEVALGGVRVEWARGMMFLTGMWNAFKATFVDTFHDACSVVEVAWNDLTAAIETVWNEMTSAIGEAFLEVVEGILSAAADIVDAFDLGDVFGGLRKAASETKKVKDAVGTDREAETKRIEDVRAKKEAAILIGAGNDAAGRKLARADDLKAAMDAFNAASNDFNNAQIKIAMAAAAAANQMAAAEKLYGYDKTHKTAAAAMPKPTELFAAAKGTFALPDAQMQLGYGDNMGKRQLDAQIGVKTSVDKANAAICATVKDISGLFKFK